MHNPIIVKFKSPFQQINPKPTCKKIFLPIGIKPTPFIHLEKFTTPGHKTGQKLADFHIEMKHAKALSSSILAKI